MTSVLGIVEVERLVHSVLVVVAVVINRKIEQCSCVRNGRILTLDKADYCILVYRVVRGEYNLFLICQLVSVFIFSVEFNLAVDLNYESRAVTL